jgi:hypothetical protein
LGEDVDRLVGKLIEVRRRGGYVSGSYARARQIGETVHARGGTNLMVAANYRVRIALGGGAARELESAWDNIGEWAA